MTAKEPDWELAPKEELIRRLEKIKESNRIMSIIKRINKEHSEELEEQAKKILNPLYSILKNPESSSTEVFDKIVELKEKHITNKERGQKND